MVCDWLGIPWPKAWIRAGGCLQSRARSAETITHASAPSVSRQLSNRHSGSLIQRASMYCSRVIVRSYMIALGLLLAIGGTGTKSACLWLGRFDRLSFFAN